MAAEDRFRVHVVLELQPVVIGIDQEKGVVLQHIPAVAQLGLHAEAQLRSPRPIPPEGPLRQSVKHQAEMARINPPLGGFLHLGGVLGHQLVLSQVEDQGLGAAAPHPATQATRIPLLRVGQIGGGNREMETQQSHGAEASGAAPNLWSILGGRGHP